MSNWMPIHLWEVIYRNEKEMTENYNQDYFDSANHCFQKLIGEHEYTPNTTHYPKVIASMTYKDLVQSKTNNLRKQN